MDDLRRPSLDGATLRIERAIRHFDEFEKSSSEFRKSNRDKVVIKQDSGNPQSLPVTFHDSLIVPLCLSLPVSDCIHNLRAALDYLIYELAFLDSGTVKDGTQFPIEDDPQAFNKKRRNRYLCGLSDDHIRKIESLQPYNGVNWTRTLRTISNPDKHRHLVVMKPQVSTVVYTHNSGEVSDTVISVNGEQTFLKKEDVLSIGFADSQVPVVETLISLIAEAGKTVDTFKSEFK
jgi:hypothetical protein